MPTKVTIEYEDIIHLPIQRVFELAIQWLQGEHKAKILKKTNAPNYIEAKQGTMNTSSGFDPIWKKRIWINLFEKGGTETIVKVRAMPIGRNIRTKHIPKLKDAWWIGLFEGFYKLLVQMEEGPKKEVPALAQPQINTEDLEEAKVSFCPNCGKKLNEEVKVCPDCGVEIL